MVYPSYTRISDLGKRVSSLTSNTNDVQTPYAYDEIAHVQMPPGYADFPEDERIFPSLTLTNDWSFGDLLLLLSDIFYALFMYESRPQVFRRQPRILYE